MNGSDFPSFEQINSDIDRFVQSNARIAECRRIGLSADGRDVRAVFVTDPDVPSDEKEVAMVVCGRHGNERGTRGVGAALLRRLALPECEAMRRRQVVIVVPVANPDGCVRDAFHAPNDGLSELERNTIVRLADTHQPDIVVDVHSLDSSDTEVIITGHTMAAAEDTWIHGLLARRAAREACRQGYPFAIHSVARRSSYNNFFCGRCYEAFHSLAFGMEVNHYSLTTEEAAESGAMVIRSLLQARHEHLPWQRQAEYPNKLLAGDLFTSLRAAGTTATARRDARSALWANRNGFGRLLRQAPDNDTVLVKVEYTGPQITAEFSLCVRVRGHRRAERVRINGADAPHVGHTDACSTYVCGTVEPPATGHCEMHVEFTPLT